MESKDPECGDVIRDVENISTTAVKKQSKPAEVLIEAYGVAIIRGSFDSIRHRLIPLRMTVLVFPGFRWCDLRLPTAIVQRQTWRLTVSGEAAVNARFGKNHRLTQRTPSTRTTETDRGHYYLSPRLASVTLC